MIRFEKVTSDNFEDVINLKMKDLQIGFMENNLYGMDYVYFKRLMIDQCYQGKGFGKAALEEAGRFFKKEYPSIGFIELMHYMDNETGASLYEAAGYKSTGEVRRTPRPGTNDEYDEELVRRVYFEE